MNKTAAVTCLSCTKVLKVVVPTATTNLGTCSLCGTQFRRGKAAHVDAAALDGEFAPDFEEQPTRLS